MTKRFVRLAGLLPTLICLILMTVAGFAQSHPVEGIYNVTATSSETGTLNFFMTLKREGGKWIGEIKDSPQPLTVTSVIVDENNKITVIADAGGTPVTIGGKFDAGKITGDWSAGDLKGTWAGTRKDAVAATPATSAAPAAGAAAAAKATAGIEGTYDAIMAAEGQPELPFTLIIKRDGDKLVTEVPGEGPLKIVAIDIKDPDVVNLSATFQGQGPFPLPGKRTGDELGGKWEAGGFSGTWAAKKKK